MESITTWQQRQVEWDKYYLGMVDHVASRSEDPSTKVGAILVDMNNRIVSTGYNGFASGIDESPERWERPLKYDFVIHAEMNAIIYSGFTPGSTLYISAFPCSNCAKHVCQAGVARNVP